MRQAVHPPTVPGLSPNVPPHAERLEQLRRLALSYRRVCVIGLGYVGLPTALLFARNGFSVQGVDISPSVLAMLAESRVGAAYPELSAWWEDVRATDAFRASARPEPADVFLITVPTPVHPESKACDLSMVRAAVESILPVLEAGNLVVLESTVPPGTTRQLVKPLIEAKAGLCVMPSGTQEEARNATQEEAQTGDRLIGRSAGPELFLCFSPERVLPGNTTQELLHNDRVVGGTTPDAALLGQALLSRVMKGRIDVTDDITAEFCKLAENTYRDVNIALANELSVLADEYGISIAEARTIINRHPRVNLLQPGIGVGGHCIAVDPWFFVEASPINTRLIATSRRVNDRMPLYTAQRILKEVADPEAPRIVLAGLAYKPDVADTRESPAMRVLEHLRAAGADVIAYDPLLPEHQGRTLRDMAQGADYLAILVGHAALLEELSAHRPAIEAAMRTPRIRVF